jgi:hypothetical protein
MGARHARFWHYFFSRFFATLMSLLARINRGHLDFSQLLRLSTSFALGIAVEASGIQLNSSFQARPCTCRHLARLGTSGSHISTSPRPVTESKSSPYNSKFGASATSRADSGSHLFQIVAQVLRIVET